MGTGGLHDFPELLRVLQHGAGAQMIVIEGLTVVIGHEDGTAHHIQQAHVPDIGVGIVDEHAGVAVTVGVDVQIPPSAGDTAAHILAIVLEVHGEDGLSGADVPDPVIHEFPLLRVGQQLRRGIVAHGHIVEVPHESRTPLHHLVDELVGADGVQILAGIAAGQTEGQVLFLQDCHNSTTLLAGIESTYTKDGKTYYVLGDGSMMEESEYLKKYPVPEVEWWTYEEYKEWLENEKKELQSILGATGTGNGKKIVWTQEKIDETIAMYEEMLQDIKNGVKYSKTVDGQEDVLLAMNPGPIDTTVEVSMDINSTESDELTQKKMLDLYGDYGISFDESGNMLFQGDLVRLFWDGVDAGDGASSVLCQYYNEKGTVDVHTVRSVIDNGDGSVDPFGKLIKIEKDSQEVFDSRDMDDYLSDGPSTTTASGFSNSNDGTSFAEVMKKYAEFGIRYESGDGLGNIYYNNQLVKTFIDKNKQGDVFTLSSEDGGEIVVHTVYDKKGNLTGVEIE